MGGKICGTAILLVAVYGSLPIQERAPLSYQGRELVLYPETLDAPPDLPSPYVTASGVELVVAVTKEGKYGIFPIDLKVDGDWSANVVDSEDFPTLARTGLHSPEELRGRTHVTGRSVEEITRLARPGGLSQDGFLAADEDLISVLLGDNELVRRIGLTHPQVARPLFHVLKMMETDLRLDRWNMAKHQWENVTSLLYNGHRVHVEAHDTKGGQLSVFGDGLEGGFFIEIHRELSREEDRFLRQRYGSLLEDDFKRMEARLSRMLTGELEPQYITRYGFYEGHTGWRTDPLAISLIFGLRSIEEIEAAFPGQIDLVLTRHFTGET